MLTPPSTCSLPTTLLMCSQTTPWFCLWSFPSWACPKHLTKEGSGRQTIPEQQLVWDQLVSTHHLQEQLQGFDALWIADWVPIKSLFCIFTVKQKFYSIIQTFTLFSMMIMLCMILTVWQVIYKTFLTIFVLTFSIYSVEYSGIQVNSVHRVLHGHSNGSIQKKSVLLITTV